MNESTLFTNTTHELAISTMIELIERPLSKALISKSNPKINPLETILTNLKEKHYKTLEEWKKAIDDIFLREPDDDDEHRIIDQLVIDFEKKYRFIYDISNCKFQSILNRVNNVILKNTAHNTGESFSFKKLSENEAG